MSYIYIVGFGDTGRVKVGYSAATPERRIEAHKRGARAYLECDDFAEWTSPNHQEGAENERALIAWCRERSQTQVGEYFSLPFAEVLAYGQSLPMTVTSETPTERNAADWGALTMELAHGNAAYRGLRELLGEDGVDILEFALNPNYPLPARSIPVGDVEPQLVADLVAEQASLGLGMSYLDIAAGIVINKIRRATVKRRIQARAAGRLDLAEAVS